MTVDLDLPSAVFVLLCLAQTSPRYGKPLTASVNNGK